MRVVPPTDVAFAPTPTTPEDFAAIMLMFDVPLEAYTFRGRTPEAFHTRQLERAAAAASTEEAERILAEPRPARSWVRRQRQLRRELAAAERAAADPPLRRAPSTPLLPPAATSEGQGNGTNQDHGSNDPDEGQGAVVADEDEIALANASFLRGLAAHEPQPPSRSAPLRAEAVLGHRQQRARVEAQRHIVEAVAALARANLLPYGPRRRSPRNVVRDLRRVLDAIDPPAAHSATRRRRGRAA